MSIHHPAELLNLHAIEFEKPIIPQSDLGIAGKLKWLNLGLLRIDPRYQRPIGARGRKNIRHIVEEFDWSLFSPIVVAGRPNGFFAIIDGQHRAIAAWTHGGIHEVPCLIIVGDERAEARAFAIINGQVTAVTPTQIHAARVMAGEPAALELDKVCQAAGVTVLRTPRGAYKVGETFAIGALETCLSKFGRDTLITALQCVTETGDGNAGMLNKACIMAFSDVLDRHRDWRDAGEALFKAVESAGGIASMLRVAKRLQNSHGGSVQKNLIRAVEGALAQTMPKALA